MTRNAHTNPLPDGVSETHHEHSEATTTILVPKDQTAFLNPVQEFNRDLSVAVIRAWNEMRKEELEAKWRSKPKRGKKKRKAKEEQDHLGQRSLQGEVLNLMTSRGDRSCT